VISHGSLTTERQRARRELLHSYLRLQRELIEGEPGTASYQGTIHAFRQMGYALISAGFEDDLDRLLRIRILDGGKAVSQPREQRSGIPELHVVEQHF
jgi:hypothetical protein